MSPDGHGPRLMVQVNEYLPKVYDTPSNNDLFGWALEEVLQSDIVRYCHLIFLKATKFQENFTMIFTVK